MPVSSHSRARPSGAMRDRSWRRRILRVHPAYLATLSVLLPLGWYGLMPKPNDLGDVLLHLVMFHNVVAEDMPSINGVYWSMPFEFQFYLLFPLLVLPLLRGRSGVLLAAGVGVALLFKLESALLGPSHAMAQLPWRIDEFVVGMAAASIAMRRRWTAGTHALVAWLAVVSLVAGACLVARIDPIWWQPGPLPIVRAAWIDITIAALLVGICADRGAVARLFGWRPVVWLGLISYSVYLWHLPTLLLARMKMSELFPAAPVVVHFGAVVVVIVAVSALSYYADREAVPRAVARGAGGVARSAAFVSRAWSCGARHCWRWPSCTDVERAARPRISARDGRRGWIQHDARQPRGVGFGVECERDLDLLDEARRSSPAAGPVERHRVAGAMPDRVHCASPSARARIVTATPDGAPSSRRMTRASVRGRMS